MSDLPQQPLVIVDPDDLDNNPNTNDAHLNDLVAARLNRRHLLKGGVGAMTVAGLGSLALASQDARADSRNVGDTARPAPGRRPATSLDFDAVPKSLVDGIAIAEGYTAQVIFATGDSIDPRVPDYRGDGSETNYQRRAGDHHDGMHFFALKDRAGRRDDKDGDAGLLAVNHENITGTAQFLHPTGETNVTGSLPRPEDEVIKEQDAHGVSVIELRRQRRGYALNQASRFNRRITARTVVDIHGPACGNAQLRTKFSPTGVKARGTLNNCGHGVTPWGTYLTCEENWAGYFVRAAGDDTKRGPREEASLQRNGIRPGQAGFAHRRWASVVPVHHADATDFSRWDCSVVGADPTEDFRNEPNTFGYIVEIDPYDPKSRPRKRTALGRRANEGAWCSLPKAGRPLAFYIGCDSRNEYVYKYVTDARWSPADGHRGGLDVGDKYLDRGTIHAAVFNADGTGRWEPLTLDNPKVAAGATAIVRPSSGGQTTTTYTFEDLADICINTRLAAGAAGATRMDRPEWTAVNPFNGEVYITMTENPDRGNINAISANNVPNPDLDAANPRYWFDTKDATSQGPKVPAQRGNVNGHIVRIREDGDDAGAKTFRWDVFLFGAQAAADPGLDDVDYQRNVNLSGLSEFNDFSKPDGCWFSPTTGILYIQTDDNTMTDRTNAMLLAAIPGELGDGAAVDVVNRAAGSPDAGVRASGQDKVVRTYAGRRATDATLKRLVVAPLGAEITGLTESPDGRALFINVQHPGENTGRSGAVPASLALTPSTLNGPFESNWPGNGVGLPAEYGPGGQTARPRSATLVITRDDGGIIGWDPKKPVD